MTARCGVQCPLIYAEEEVLYNHEMRQCVFVSVLKLEFEGKFRIASSVKYN